MELRVALLRGRSIASTSTLNAARRRMIGGLCAIEPSERGHRLLLAPGARGSIWSSGVRRELSTLGAREIVVSEGDYAVLLGPGRSVFFQLCSPERPRESDGPPRALAAALVLLGIAQGTAAMTPARAPSVRVSSTVLVRPVRSAQSRLAHVSRAKD